MNNTLKYYIHATANSLILLFLSGAVFQTVLIEGGMAEETVNYVVSAIYILQLVSMALLSKKFDNLKNIIKTSGYLFLMLIPHMAVLFLICLSGNVNTIPLFLMITGVVMYAIATGMTSVIAYKLPYHVIDMSQYGKITAISGIAIGIGSVLFSGLISLLDKHFEYFGFMKYVYISGFALIGIYILVTVTMKNVGKYEPNPETVKINLIKYKPFYALIIPNFIRGFVLGIVQLAVTIGYYAELLDSASAAVMMLVTNAVTIFGCFIYSRVSGRVKERKILLVSNIAVCIFMPMMMIGHNTAVFVTFYGITYFFVTIVNYSVPVAVTKIMDYSVAGQYSAGRILLNTAGIAAGGFVCVGMFKLMGIVPSLVLIGLMQLGVGVWYYCYLRKNVPAA